MSALTLSRRVRALGTGWIAEQTLDHLEAIRLHELHRVLEFFPPKARVLEIGAGTGWQAKALAEQGYEVCAIDLASSNYRDNLVWPVREYDGRSIPYAAGSFDVVFSSNVLEHIGHLNTFQSEIRRALKPAGQAIHVVPSGTWSLWTNLTTLLKYWQVAKPHGEHARSATAEILQFSRRAWARRFEEAGWNVMVEQPMGLFYSGCSIMDRRLSISAREKLSRFLGSSCSLFVMRANS